MERSITRSIDRSSSRNRAPLAATAIAAVPNA
jgi:hypothetical protein